MPGPIPPSELREAVNLVRDWSPLRGARIFITGGTGFFGKWLIEVLGAAERTYGLGVQAVLLSRDPDRFLHTMPHLQSAPWLSFHQGDITSFRVPNGTFSHLIHGAGSSDARNYLQAPMVMKRAIVDGAKHTMSAISEQALLRVLFLSSGAVYGPQPKGLDRIPDDFTGPVDLGAHTPAQVYAEAKREAEQVVSSNCQRLGYPCSIARCFAFAGPHLPLDQHFAFGNFLRDALAGGPILVLGDGTPLRSYLYASELAAWLWTLLIQGDSTTYNVGSDQAISIRELAEMVGREASLPVRTTQNPAPGQEPSRYVPEIAKMRNHFGLSPRIDIQESIRRTFLWHLG